MVGILALIRLFEIGNDGGQESARFAAGNAAMIEAQRKGHAPMRLDRTRNGDRVLAHLARAQDGDRGRHYQRNSVAAGESAEIRQHQREVAQILRPSAAPVSRLLLQCDGRTQEDALACRCCRRRP